MLNYWIFGTRRSDRFEIAMNIICNEDSVEVAIDVAATLEASGHYNNLRVDYIKQGKKRTIWRGREE